MSPESDPPVRMTARRAGDRPDGPMSEGERPRRMQKLAVLRWLFVVASAGGIVAAAWLWGAGHGALALRVLAGDVVAILVAVLASA